MRTIILKRDLLLFTLLFAVAASTGAASRHEQAMELANQGRIEESIKLLEGPEGTDERLLLSRLYDYDGQPERAVEILEAGLLDDVSDMYLLAQCFEIFARQGKDGPTVSYKRGSVCYSPSKDAAAEDAWKRERMERALVVCGKALVLIPEDEYFRYQKAQALIALERFDEAAELLKGLSESDPDSAELINELASVYLQGGSTNEAVKCLNVCIEKDPRSASAYRMLSEFYSGIKDDEKTEQYSRMAEFYEWIPPFAELTFTSNNAAVCDVLSGRTEEAAVGKEAQVDNLIADVENSDAMVFLAALCYHHADHGTLEEKAFKALEERGEAGVPLLFNLLVSAESVCTGRQAAEALARQKCQMAVAPLIELLPMDTRWIWTYNAAGCLAQIGDVSAVEPLLKLADVETELSKPDDDPMNGFNGRMAARYRAAVALGTFDSDRELLERKLKTGLSNPQMELACRAALYLLTGDEEHKKAVARLIEEDETYRFELECAVRAIEEPQERRNVLLDLVKEPESKKKQ